MMPDPKIVLDQWYRYEEIAMHFNNLIMQFRLQLLGGVGLIGTIASYLIGGKISKHRQRHWVAAVASAGLFAVILAGAVLDIGYYSRLLEGAVRALLEFEAKNPEIQMSTRIEQIAGPGKHVAWVSYGLILVPLVGFSIWSFIRHRRELKRLRKPRPARTQPSATAKGPQPRA